MTARSRSRAAFASGLAVAALVVATAAPAAAQGPPRSGTGQGFVTSLVETSSRDAGGNRIAERVLEGVMTGALEGTFREEVRGVVHRNGRVTFHGTLWFEGTAEGCGTGTVVARLAGRGTAGAAPITDATFTLVQRPSGTIAAAGHGTVHQEGPLLSYQVRYVC